MPKTSQIVDLSSYRADFPVFEKEMNAQPLVYLDTAASAQKPRQVINAMTHIMENNYSNIHRGLYNFSQVNTESYEAVRDKVRGFINAPSQNEIIFTRNTSEAINLVAESWGRTFMSKGDEVILTELEHHANLVPWQELAQKIGIKLQFLSVLDNGELDLSQLSSILNKNTKFLSIVHTSNALGTINPIQKIISQVKEYDPNIRVLVDASQAVVHSSVDIQALGAEDQGK